MGLGNLSHTPSSSRDVLDNVVRFVICMEAGNILCLACKVTSDMCEALDNRDFQPKYA